MGYSYCSSELNLTIHFAKSQFHFPYSVTLGTKGLVISHLCTRVPFETATSSTRGKSLYPTFVVYLRTIHGPLSFISCHHPKVTFPEWIILLFKELIGLVYQTNHSSTILLRDLSSTFRTINKNHFLGNFFHSSEQKSCLTVFVSDEHNFRTFCNFFTSNVFCCCHCVGCFVLFYKFKSKFSICQIFLKLFFKIRDLYLNRSPSQIFYKYTANFSICQIYLYFFFDSTFRVSFITYRCQIFYKCKDKYVTKQVKS